MYLRLLPLVLPSSECMTKQYHQVTDATVTAFNALKVGQQEALLRDLFSENGINFSLMRHTIAASDLSSFAYSYDNITQPDPQLLAFNLLPPGRAMTAFIRSMVITNPMIKLLGSVWSPPGWMKLNGVMLGTTINNNLNPVYASSYAQYFVDYIRRYHAQGVTVDFITIQNEPLNSNAGSRTLYVSAENATNLIQNFVGPALKKANIKTQIWAYDHNTGMSSRLAYLIPAAATN